MERRTELDGLRLFAFLAVFFLHFRFSVSPEHTILLRFEKVGWIGVEVFFTLSAYLLFTLLDDEQSRFGKVSISKFYLRRFLRIYPLMIAYAVLMFALYGAQNPNAWAWLLGIASLSGNLLMSVDKIGRSIYGTTHLWSLAYEFQIYLILPLLFLAYVHAGKERFLIALASIIPLCLAARAAVAFASPTPLSIYMTPILRPESTLVGIAIALGAFDRLPLRAVSSLAAISFVMLLFPEWFGNVISRYLISATFSGSIVILTLRSEHLSSALRWSPLVWLGSISFGLYVFHPFALRLGRLVTYGSGHDLGVWGLLFASLAFCIAMAAISFYGFERLFLNLKPRSGSRATRRMADQQLVSLAE